jgi:hypothetical protein
MSSSRPWAAVAAFFGLVAVFAVPAAAALAAYTTRVTLLRGVYVAVPVACGAALIAVSAYRRSRARLERSVRRAGVRVVRLARYLAFAGLYVAVTGALALGFYGLLHLRS